jgi:hypothetical protein
MSSDPSDPTSSDVSDIIDDTSDSDSDSDDEDDKTIENSNRKFDANSSLPPVPNGTLDLTIPSDKQRFSSDDERYVIEGGDGLIMCHISTYFFL